MQLKVQTTEGELRPVLMAAIKQVWVNDIFQSKVLTVIFLNSKAINNTESSCWNMKESKVNLVLDSGEGHC